MATAAAPRSFSSASMACSRMASGVVWAVGANSPGKPYPKVPTTPQGRSPASARAMNWQTLVLPLVPVAAIRSRPLLGSP